LIDGSLKGGDTVLVDYDPSKDQFVFRKTASAPQPPAASAPSNPNTTPAEEPKVEAQSTETPAGETPEENPAITPETPTPDAGGAGQALELPKQDEDSASA